MKTEILDIAKKLYHNHLTPEIATNLLLDLFAVSGRSEQLKCEGCLKDLKEDCYCQDCYIKHGELQ